MLQWLSDTRDPFNSGHGYLWAASAAECAAQLESDTEQEAALDRLRALGQRVYGSADAVDPCSGYKGKAYPGYYQILRSVIKDCLSADAHFPLIYRKNAPDHYWRLHGIEGIGDIEGPSIEYHLFSAGTGVTWSEKAFARAAERICSLERALQVRHWARDRESIRILSWTGVTLWIVNSSSLSWMNSIRYTVGTSSEVGPLGNVCASLAWKMCTSRWSMEQQASNKFDRLLEQGRK